MVEDDDLGVGVDVKDGVDRLALIVFRDNELRLDQAAEAPAVEAENKPLGEPARKRRFLHERLLLRWRFYNDDVMTCERVSKIEEV